MHVSHCHTSADTCATDSTSKLLNTIFLSLSLSLPRTLFFLGFLLLGGLPQDPSKFSFDLRLVRWVSYLNPAFDLSFGSPIDTVALLIH